MTQEDYGNAYQRGFALTVRFLLSRGIRGETALEFAQSGWARGWERKSQLRNEKMVATWVNSIALNHYREWLRKHESQQILTDLPGGEETNLAVMDMNRLLASLPHNERCLLERRMQGASINELARDHNVNDATMRLRLLRARRSAKTLAEKGSPARCLA